MGRRGESSCTGTCSVRHSLAVYSDTKHRSSILFAAMIFTLAAPAVAEPTILTGAVTKVRDGDTIEVGKVPIRLNGVSAPELNEPLGPLSKAFMIDLVLGKPVRCELNGERTHDRLVGICHLDSKNIGISIIKAGLAIDCPKYSDGMYAEYETVKAKQAIKLPKYCQ